MKDTRKIVMLFEVEVLYKDCVDDETLEKEYGDSIRKWAESMYKDKGIWWDSEMTLLDAFIKNDMSNLIKTNTSSPWKKIGTDMTINLALNERYVIYALAHGNTPKEQFKKDKITYKGGVMAGYINWVDRSFKAYEKETGNTKIVDQDEFDKWLKNNIKDK